MHKSWQRAFSYFLWNTTPDAELLNPRPRESSLHVKAFAQASRLLDSPKSRDGMRNFFSEQLKLYDVSHFQKDPQVFEHFTSSLGDDAAEETLKLLEYIVFEEDGDYRDIMTTSKTFINRQLAALYDVPSPSAEEFSYVDLEDYSSRVGLLGHASILGPNSHAVSSSPTLRGKAVRNILLCQLIPHPRLMSTPPFLNRQAPPTLMGAGSRAPHRPIVRRLPPSHRSHRLRTRELRRNRTMERL